MPKSPIRRILSIVKYLYLSKSLKVTDLSKEYSVSEKTIRRDFKKIGESLPISNKRGIYSLDIEKLFSLSLNYSLLSAFASNADIVFDCFEKSNLTQEKIAFAIEFNHLPKKLAEDLWSCIDNGYKGTFIYKKPKESTRRIVSPIKFYSEKERWYLIAKDDKDNIVKTFYFGKIFDFKALVDTPVSLTQKDIDEANSKVSVWSDSTKEEWLVKLYVKPKIAEFILDGKLHKSQKIVDIHCDGGLEVHYHITHKLEILPRLMSYFPYIHIIEPQWLRDELKQDLETYQKEMLEMDI